MNTDSQSREPKITIPDWWRLPDIVDLEIRRIRFKPPGYKFVESAYASHREAVEFLVTYEGEYERTRALSPILFVGDVPVGESELLEDNKIRFLAFETEKLEEGAPIYLGWPGRTDMRKETDFRYQEKNIDYKKE